MPTVSKTRSGLRNTLPRRITCATVLYIIGMGCVSALLSPEPVLADDRTKPSATRRKPIGKVTVDADGAVHLPPMTVPFSGLASPEAKAAFLKYQEFLKQYGELLKLPIAEQRQKWAEQWKPAIDREKILYPVESTPTVIAGVYTDVITPKDGIAPRNQNRVLIDLHGGGFSSGARVMGALESMPVASLAKIKVVTVDYRQGPENKFPAASEDVAAVYKELLKSYKPQNVGIYGCSAGGVLTAEAMAWIEKENLPSPGALGIFCGSADGWTGGDSDVFGLPLMGVTPPQRPAAPKPHPSVSDVVYFSDADIDDPLVSPIRSTAVLAKFPPTLIVTSTRDLALSPAIYTHTQLVKLGVDAELHIWEGMLHGFFTTEPDLPETKEVWDVVTKFFDKHLGVE